MGECGQGKSTFLSKVSEIYSNEFNETSKNVQIEFDASKSFDAVTGFVRMASNGSMTLIDTPGLNDPDKMRSDKMIFMDLINTVRLPFRSPTQGISRFIQCMMPDESDRIRKTAIMTMLDLLLILSVFNSDTTAEQLRDSHPKISVIFNHVSRY